MCKLRLGPFTSGDNGEEERNGHSISGRPSSPFAKEHGAGAFHGEDALRVPEGTTGLATQAAQCKIEARGHHTDREGTLNWWLLRAVENHASILISL